MRSVRIDTRLRVCMKKFVYKREPLSFYRFILVQVVHESSIYPRSFNSPLNVPLRRSRTKWSTSYRIRVRERRVM